MIEGAKSCSDRSRRIRPRQAKSSGPSDKAKAKAKADVFAPFIYEIRSTLIHLQDPPTQQAASSSDYVSVQFLRCLPCIRRRLVSYVVGSKYLQTRAIQYVRRRVKRDHLLKAKHFKPNAKGCLRAAPPPKPSNDAFSSPRTGWRHLLHRRPATNPNHFKAVTLPKIDQASANQISFLPISHITFSGLPCPCYFHSLPLPLPSSHHSPIYSPSSTSPLPTFHPKQLVVDRHCLAIDINTTSLDNSGARLLIGIQFDYLQSLYYPAQLCTIRSINRTDCQSDQLSSHYIYIQTGLHCHLLESTIMSEREAAPTKPLAKFRRRLSKIIGKDDAKRASQGESSSPPAATT